MRIGLLIRQFRFPEPVCPPRNMNPIWHRTNFFSELVTGSWFPVPLLSAVEAGPGGSLDYTPSPRPNPGGPRKVIVATSIFGVQPSARVYHGLDHRLVEVGERIDEMAAEARGRHGRGLDLAVFPENTLNPKDGGPLLDRSIELDSRVRDRIGGKAREHNCYIVVSFNMIEDRATEFVSNVAVLFDRTGNVAGIYRKVFCVAYPGRELLEGGKTPGTEFPVFDTDFGRLGMQVCYDIAFEDGWKALGTAGAEIIAWTTMSPQTFLPRSHARRFGYYIVSATPRNNASVFDPLGRVAAQVTEPEQPLTCEIDLDWRVVHWQPKLRNGQTLRERYGDRVGFHYSEREDYGIFWSNDPNTPIEKMLEETKLLAEDVYLPRNRALRERILATQSVRG